ncbi:hypothetical protein KCV00_g3, partial [Aureobasidium melanogenum]
MNRANVQLCFRQHGQARPERVKALLASTAVERKVRIADVTMYQSIHWGLGRRACDAYLIYMFELLILPALRVEPTDRDFRLL